MNIEKELSAQLKEDEKISNRYVINTTHVIILISFIFELFNEAGIFYIDKHLFRGSFIVSLILTAISFILSFFPNFISPAKLKYLIMSNLIITVFITVSLLSFHATLFVFLPMIISTHYHSRKMTTLGIAGTCITALLSPLVSLKLSTFDSTFLVYLLRILSPENLTQSSLVDFLMESKPTNSLYGIFTFYALPHFLICIGFGVIARTVNLSRRDGQKARVTEIKIIQDKILYSVANLVESRDLSTGSHIKRTSEVVRILVNELKESDQKHSVFFWNSVVNAAPMHDLGKISIPDSILQKPGKLTDQEFEIIKSHSQRSAEIIDQVLGDIESKEFLTIAENIARYHHEWFDGSGYPCHLKGKEIPYEARIMAVADVFDALVSERCYKEPISAEEAYVIIKDSMGTHFDPDLFDTFNNCFPRLKEYYQSEKKAGN